MMTSELSKHLTEQLGVFFKCKTTKIKLAKNIKNGFLSENVFYNVIFYQLFLLFKFSKISYVLL